MLTLHNTEIEVVVEPEFGAQIVSMNRPGAGVNALAHYDWSTPLRARDGHRYGDSSSDWLSNYRGGWQELFPNSGAESPALETVTPFHGEVSTTGWSVVEADATSCTLRTGTRLPLVLTRRMRLQVDSPTLLIEERVENHAQFDVPCVWAHHPTFPAPDGTRVDLPACSVAVEPANHNGLAATGGTWPVVDSQHGGEVDLSVIDGSVAHRLTYQYSLAQGWVAVRPPAAENRPGVALAWDLKTWPALWMWLLADSPEFPWYGRARMVGLEPNRAWPFDGLHGAIQRGQHLTLPAGGHHTTWLTVRLLDRTDIPVSGVNRDGTVVQEGP